MVVIYVILTFKKLSLRALIIFALYSKNVLNIFDILYAKLS